MQKYGSSGEKIYSFNDDMDIDNLWEEWDRSPCQKDMFEVLVKGAAFELFNNGSLQATHRDILLYSMGIDEYYPRLTAKQMAKKFKIPNTDIRSIRFHAARKVLREILKDV